MVKIIDKINQVIEKMGQRNFMLVLFVFFITIIGGLYGTFSIFTSTDGVSVIDGVKTYKFILNPDNTTNSITIAGNSNKFVALTISNPDPTDGKTTTLKYGIYYSSSSTLTNVQVGYLKSSEYKGTDLIAPNKEQVVTLKIDNNTSSNITITFGVTYGMEKAGDLILPDGKVWLEKYTGNILTNYVKNLYNDGSTLNTVNIGGSTDNPTVSLNAGQSIMLDNNGDYRYYGATPNNYVSYNDELWRIISVGTVYASELDTEGEMRAKIIKATPLTDDNGLSTYSFDSSDSDTNSGQGINDWTRSNAQNILNNFYYNKSSGTCYIGQNNLSTECSFADTGINIFAQKLIDNALYYLGGSTLVEEDIYADDYYNFERGTTVYDCSTIDTACPRRTTWTGIMGLIYPSDYAYAADLSVCTASGRGYDSANCYQNDWMVNVGDIFFSMTPKSDSSFRVYGFNETGFISHRKVYYAENLFPAAYLKSNVVITSGDGTETNPYQLALG